MTTTVFDRNRKSGQAVVGQSGQDPAVFSSAGIAEVSDAEPFLAKMGGLEIPGKPKFFCYLDVAGNAAATKITVPAGKYWRVLSGVFELATSADVANRALVCKTVDVCRRCD